MKIKDDCIYYDWEDIGGIPEENLVQTVWFCACAGHSGEPDDFTCEEKKCKDYVNEDDLE